MNRAITSAVIMTTTQIMLVVHIMEMSTKKDTATAVPKTKILYAHKEEAATIAATDENILSKDLNAVITTISSLNIQ